MTETDNRPSSPFTRSRSISAIEFITRVAHAAPVAVAGNLTKRPLTDDQTAILQSIASSPFPGHGWIWGNYSTSARLLDALVAKGLVSKDDQPHLGNRPTYRAKAFVSAVYAEIQKTQREAQARHHAAEATAQREADLERHGRSARLERTLANALDALEGECGPSESITAARAFVANLAEQNARSQARLDEGKRSLPIQVSTSV